MKKLLTGIIVAILILIAGFYFFNNSSSNITGNVISQGNADDSNVETFSVTGSHLRFYINKVENPDIIVKQGDKVRIEFTSTEGFHDWKIDEFNVATQKVMPGNTTSVEFIADKKGVFEYYCSVGQHRANGMRGKFIVE